MIKKKILKEDSAAAVVNSADHGNRITINSSDVKLTDLLDELLERNLETFNINAELIKDGELPDKNFVNLLVVGIGGTGKTSIIEQWAHSRHLNLVTKAASIMDEAELNGIPVANNEDQSARMLRMNEFDALDEPDSVLFLDEFNRGRATVRGTLLKLIQGHTIPDPSIRGGIKFLPNLLFTIAAINPADPNYNTDQLDDAELSRFIVYLQEGADKYEYLDWITKTLKRRSEILGRIQKQDSRMKSSADALAANQRRLDLITFLIKDKRFMFDDSSDISKAHAAARGDTLPATILSRCQRFDFKKISNEDIIKRLEIVCKESNIEITKEAMQIIATLSEGALRDALSILERCIQDGENQIDEDKIKDLVGIPKMVYVHDIVDAIIQYDVDKALVTVNEVLEDGKDISNLLWEIIKYVKDILLYKATNHVELYNEEEKQKLKEISEKVEKERLINLVYAFSELENEMKFSTQKSIIFQAGIIKLCSKLTINSVGNSDLEQRVDKIENYLRSHTGNANSYRPQPVGAEVKMAYNTPVNNTQTVKNNEKKTDTNSKKMQTSTYSSKVEEYWPQIVKDLKQNGKIVLYTNLMNTRAREINDMTVGIEFPNGLTSFGKTVLEKQENIKELTNLVSMASGKPMNIKYITNVGNAGETKEPNIKSIANDSDIPFHVIE